jgi:adenylate cyclase
MLSMVVEAALDALGEAMTERAEAAVLFADVSGSTRLYEKAGDAAALAGIGSCVNLLKRISTDFGGRVIKTIGDEVLVVFPSATFAADGAVSMNREVAELPPIAGAKLGIRVGFHFGSIMNRDGDVFGDSVNLAARLTSLASRGQIITSEQSFRLLDGSVQGFCRPLYPAQVKGKALEVMLYELLWYQSDDGATLAARRSLYSPKQTNLHLYYHELELVLSRDRSSLSIGRDSASDLVVRDKMASRMHGKIERRLEKYALIDHSVNGTFVKNDGEREIILRREDFILHGEGSISFGQSCEKTTDIVRFKCP